MKDLYHRVGLASHTDDRSKIERALSSASGDPASARAARHVLLNPDRKEVYDRTRSVLIRVGQLRANLGLSRAPHWLVSDCSDFDADPSLSISDLRALRARMRIPRPTMKPSGRVVENGTRAGDRPIRPLRTTTKLCIGIVVILIFCFLLGLLLDNIEPRGYRAPHPWELSGAPADHVAARGAVPSPVLSRLSGSPDPTLDGIAEIAKARAERVRQFVTSRFARIGIAASATIVETNVQRMAHAPLATAFNIANPVPSTGLVDKNFFGEGVAPFEIKTRSGGYYFIKLVDSSTDQEVLTAFIRGGEPFETNVPIGSYRIRYAAGQFWFGEALDFGGPDFGASYSRCEDRFHFTRTSSGYNGYTIELILQPNGNLQTKPISADDF